MPITKLKPKFLIKLHLADDSSFTITTYFSDSVLDFEEKVCEKIGLGTSCRHCFDHFGAFLQDKHTGVLTELSQKNDPIVNFLGLDFSKRREYKTNSSKLKESLYLFYAQFKIVFRMRVIMRDTITQTYFRDMKRFHRYIVLLFLEAVDMITSGRIDNIGKKDLEELIALQLIIEQSFANKQENSSTKKEKTENANSVVSNGNPASIEKAKETSSIPSPRLLKKRMGRMIPASIKFKIEELEVGIWRNYAEMMSSSQKEEGFDNNKRKPQIDGNQAMKKYIEKVMSFEKFGCQMFDVQKSNESSSKLKLGINDLGIYLFANANSMTNATPTSTSTSTSTSSSSSNHLKSSKFQNKAVGVETLQPRYAEFLPWNKCYLYAYDRSELCFFDDKKMKIIAVKTNQKNIFKIVNCLKLFISLKITEKDPNSFEDIQIQSTS